MSQGSIAFDEFYARYGDPAGSEGPVLFAREVLGFELDPWQDRVLRAYGRRERQISIRACHGPGKTFLAAIMVIHHLLCRFPQKTVATAPSRGQLEDALVSEIVSMIKQLPLPLQELLEIKKNRISLKAAPEDSFFSARTARSENPEALQGVHEENVLLIADEASGVPEAIFEAAAGSMSGENATTLLLGNPVRSSGFFYDTHHKLSDTWFTVHVSHQDSPRVTDAFVEEIRRRYGEKSNAFRVRALGEFPLADLDTVIPYEIVEGARTREIEIPDNVKEIWGLDVARFGDDKNALVRRSRLGVSYDIAVWEKSDLMATAGRVKRIWDETPVELRPDEIMVDVIGLGAGVADRLMELGLPVVTVNVSEKPIEDHRFTNMRAELWWRCREWLEKGLVRIPDCDRSCVHLRDNCPHHMLFEELLAPRYEIADSSGKLKVEKKSDMKKRGLRSPNVADALMLTFASEPASLLHGSGAHDSWSHDWNAPVSRNLVN